MVLGTCWRSLCRLGQSLARKSRASRVRSLPWSHGPGKPRSPAGASSFTMAATSPTCGAAVPCLAGAGAVFSAHSWPTWLPGRRPGAFATSKSTLPQTAERFSSDWGSSSLPPPPHSRTQAEQADLSVTVLDADVGRASCPALRSHDGQRLSTPPRVRRGLLGDAAAKRRLRRRQRQIEHHLDGVAHPERTHKGAIGLDTPLALCDRQPSADTPILGDVQLEAARPGATRQRQLARTVSRPRASSTALELNAIGCPRRTFSSIFDRISVRSLSLSGLTPC